MTWYPAASGSEEDGPNFQSPVMGIPYQRGQRRLREAAAFSSMQREATKFHERMAKKHGVDRPLGLAHFRAATAYREGAGKLQEMFEKPGENISPKHQMKAHKASIKFHKGQAEKAGLDSPLAHAHLHAMEHHMDGLNKIKQQGKEAMAGHSGKQSPVPVPKKSEQPSEDVRQNLPSVPLKRLQQKQEAKIRKFGREADDGPYEGERTFPRSDRAIMKPDLVFRGKKPRPAKPGPQAAPGRIHDATHDRESRRSLRRPIWESDDSERDRSASGLTA
jgi:hypothetical protein